MVPRPARTAAGMAGRLCKESLGHEPLLLQMVYNHGCVGTILSQGEYFIVSLYNIPLLEPPLGIQRVRLRRHGSFGPHDWVEYPQLYHPNFVHFTCIPYPPKPRSKHKYSCFSSLWLPIEKGDFVQVGPGVIGGLGKISFIQFAKFRDYYWQIWTRTVDFLQFHSNATERALAWLL